MAGIGNPIMGDDAAGLVVIEELEDRDPGSDVDLYSAGVDSFGLLARIEGEDELIVVDALKGMPEGEVFELTLRDLEESDFVYSLHDFSLEHLLEIGEELFGDDFPREVAIIGIGIERAGEGIGLSTEVEDGVRDARDVVLRKIDGWREGQAVSSA